VSAFRRSAEVFAASGVRYDRGVCEPGEPHVLKRVAGHVVTFVQVVSLIACLLAVVFWVRSGWRSDRLTFRSRAGQLWAFDSAGGMARLSNDPQHDIDLDRAARAIREVGEASLKLWRERGNTTEVARLSRAMEAPVMREYARAQSAPIREYATPWVIPVLLFAVLPGLRAARVYTRHRRRRRGLCLRCGYDRRFSPDRCPECGTPPERPAAPGRMRCA
jgi:hypothetical protein